MVYQPKGVCSKAIDVEVEGSVIKSVKFTGGCNGNLQGISSLVAGMKIEDAIISVWAYAEKTGVNLDLKVCPFDEDTLNSMLALRTSAAV